MTAFGKLFVVIAAMILVFMIILGLAYIAYLKEGTREVASTMSHLLVL